MNFRKNLLGAAVAGALAAYAQGALASWVFPLERLARAFFAGPAMHNVASGPTQFSGLTTLNSGSATVTVSTTNVKSDSLIPNPGVLVSFPLGYTTKGLVSIAAGAAQGTVSTAAVYSGQAVDLQWASGASQSSGQGRGIRVDSIVGGVSFAVVTDDGQNVTSGPLAVGWSIPQAVPVGVVVTSINDSNFFTMGWADQQPRPMSATLMWEVRKTS